MLVIDTSAVVSALVGLPRDQQLVARLSEDGDLHAPHLVDIEVLHSVRRLVLDGKLTNERADDVRSDWADLAVTRYPHQGLAERIWELRHTLTAYDAAFIALAEELAVPLLTCDHRLGRGSPHRAVIEVYGEDQEPPLSPGQHRRGE